MEPTELLEKVIELFKNYKDNLKVLDYLIKHDLIHSTFEKRYILNNVDFIFTINNVFRKENDLVAFYLEALDGSPYKAEVIFDGKWYLKSFLFQCQSCFGNNSLCDVCGGSGWGVL